MKDKSTWYSGRVSTNSSVYTEYTSLLSESLRMTQCTQSPFLDYLNMSVVPVVNSALRAKTERNERRKTKAYWACEVLSLKSQGSECFQVSGWSGCRKMANFHWPVRTDGLTPGHSSLLSQPGLTQESLGTGHRRDESMPGQSHTPDASELVQRSKIKFLRVQCLDVTLKLCKDRPVSGLTSKLWAFKGTEASV